MAKDRNGTLPDDACDGGEPHYAAAAAVPSKTDRHRKSKRKKDDDCTDSSSTDESPRSSKKTHKRSRRSSKRRSRSRRRGSDSESDDSDSDSSDSESSSDESDSGASDSDSDARRRRRRRREREHEKERRRRKEKERERRRRKEKEERRRKRDKKEKDKKKLKKKDKGVAAKGAVTDSWGKYGIIRETDMWNKRPEFTAWLLEVKKVNLESLANWEEKQMFKDFMEDHNTATFPSKKYYDLDAYHQRQMEKEMKKGSMRIKETERTVFNDEEQRRLELLREREKQKEEQVEALKRSMQSGMAQAMKEQARLREEMAYQYKLGNFEAAAAIQRRLDPDVAP